MRSAFRSKPLLCFLSLTLLLLIGGYVLAMGTIPASEPESVEADCHFTIEHSNTGGRTFLLDQCTGRTWYYMDSSESRGLPPHWAVMLARPHPQ